MNARLLLSLLPALCACVHASTPLSRTAFEQHLASHDSATEALRLWCERHDMARPARITATLVQGADLPPPAGLHAMLGLPPDAPIGYRHVRLSCGDRRLSQAHNFYAPSRLTPEMNQQLNETDTPFGKVAAPLAFRRERLSTSRTPDPACPRNSISTHKALLRLPNGQGLALVIECYTPANLTTG